MPVLSVTVNLDETPWTDIRDMPEEGKLMAMGESAAKIRVGAIPRGMGSGKTSVAIAITLESGQVVLTETSLALFLMAADIFRAKYPAG